MYDLKILDSVHGTLSAQTWPSPDYVSSVYSLVQQIFKCLMTSPGEDAFDPTYGSGLRPQIIGLTGQETERVRQVISGAFRKVIADLTSGQQSDDPTERLVDLHLIELKYDFDNTAWLVKANVITAAGTQAALFSI